MKIRLYKAVFLVLLNRFGNNQLKWERHLSQWTGVRINLPKYFWEVHLYIINDKTPKFLTIDSAPEKGWHSVFYSYNLKGDMQKYIELCIIRKCKQYRNNNISIIKKAG